MTILQIILSIAALLTSLTAGLLLSFTILVMPALESLSDEEYLRGFKAIDKIIQNGHPIFLLVWGGSFLAQVVSLVMGVGQLSFVALLLLIGSLALYLFTVQVPTVLINIPLNNELQALDLEKATKERKEDFLKKFQKRWLPANSFRTVTSSLCAILLIVLTQI